jgi:two-component system OmpR family sensor kinase
MKSIRRNLLVTLLISIAVVMLSGAYATYRVAQNEANSIFDYYLRQIALSLRDPRFRFDPTLDIPDEKNFDFIIRVWNQTGVTLYYSHPHRSLPNLTRLGYSTVVTPDGVWRVYAVQYHDETIEVAQPTRVRDAQAAGAALRTLMPFIFLLPLLGLLVWVIIGRGLRPLTQLTHAVLERTSDSLDPLQVKTDTHEIQPLITALNGLLARLQLSLDSQRAFIADAAHELRTPLTALQLQIQLFERAQDEPGRQSAIAEVKAGLQRTTHVLQQLLTLARQDPSAIEQPMAVVNLVEAAQRVVIEHQPLAQAKQIDLGICETVDDAHAVGNAESVHVLLANLVSNAVRYTPVGGKVDVRIGHSDHFFVSVCDTGPGIPLEARERVFDRFYRHPGSEEPGSGLGLAIVKSIAKRMGANVILQNNTGGGLCARVEFPPSTL